MECSRTSMFPISTCFFVFPSSVNFYTDDSNTHTHVITILSIYQANVRFRVECTNPRKLKLKDHVGFIKPNHSVDLVLRHRDISPENCNITEKLRIKFYKYEDKSSGYDDSDESLMLGWREVNATLLLGVPTPELLEEGFERRIPQESASTSNPTGELNTSNKLRVAGTARSWPAPFLLVLTAVCLIALLVPHEGQESNFPICLSMSSKMLSAFFLGMMTMALFRG